MTTEIALMVASILVLGGLSLWLSSYAIGQNARADALEKQNDLLRKELLDEQFLNQRG